MGQNLVDRAVAFAHGANSPLISAGSFGRRQLRHVRPRLAIRASCGLLGPQCAHFGDGREQARQGVAGAASRHEQAEARRRDLQRRSRKQTLRNRILVASNEGRVTPTYSARGLWERGGRVLTRRMTRDVLGLAIIAALTAGLLYRTALGCFRIVIASPPLHQAADCHNTE